MLTDRFPSVPLAHVPTPLEPLHNLSRELGGPQLWVKRDDCTGLAMGGNKARQLEFYVGDALKHGADTLLTTGAVQSNHVRMTVAAARKLGLQCEVQLEERVSGRASEYHASGNPFLVKLMGARIHYYPVGEDEGGADRAIDARAQALKREGRIPYVIPLSEGHTPFGALGYVNAAEELLSQMTSLALEVAALVLPSGSASTHSGMLAGLRARNSKIPVFGFCVRRNRELQLARVRRRTHEVAQMIDHPNAVEESDILLDDSVLGKGYGQLSDAVREAIALTARCEGLLLDPTYSGKAMAGLIQLVRAQRFRSSDHVVFLHTGGTPALFGYPELLDDAESPRKQRESSA